MPDQRPAPGATTSVDRVLQLAREHLGMDVAWLSSFDGDSQRFDAVSSRVPDPRPAEGDESPLHGSFCVRVLDGRLAPAVPNALADPVTRDLTVTSELGIGAYAGVPVRRSDGSVRGMLCCTSSQPRSGIDERDVLLLELLAGVLGELADRESDGEQRRRAEIADRVLRAVRGEGRHTVFQPLVEVSTRRAVSVEALSRFADPAWTPAQCFAQAADAGLLAELELAAACDAFRALHDCPDTALTVNLSPATITSGLLDGLLEDTDVTRLTLELTEHTPVHDYGALLEALAPHRARGLRIAVDDAGAGYASFRHILMLSPDLIKVDMSLVQGIDTDPVKQALTTSLLTCAETAGATLLAEGVEREEELAALAELGVRYVQGFVFGRPRREPVTVGSPVELTPAVLPAGY